MGLVKASIKETDTGNQIECAFNPTEYSISTGAEWRQTPIAAATTAPKPQFIGTKARTMRMKLLFDAWGTDSDDVSGSVDQLLTWTNPSASSLSQGRPNPPILAFHWGQNEYFDAYLQTVDAQYTMFDSDGAPTRATVTVTLVEVPNDPDRQNPTSGGLAGHRTALLADGDTLHSVSYREYGTPSLWRALAAANHVDNPLGLVAGTTLLVPPRDLAQELAG